MRLASAVLIPLLALALLAGCTQSPPGDHAARLEKAAGLTAFRITCHKDLWSRTGAYDGPADSPIKGKITEHGSGIITVEISGPQLVDLLNKLDAFGWPNFGSTEINGPEARRLYKAIAPVVDRIKSTPRAGDPAPDVVVDDVVPGSATPMATASASKVAPKQPTANASASPTKR